MKELTSTPFSKFQEYKQLARLIKSHRTAQWPCLPTNDLPPKDLADKLVDCYLRTTEAVFRVIHIPTFKKDYEAAWLSGQDPDKEFLVQLKLILAIGAATYDEHFSLRPSAIRWVLEGQTWDSRPDFKRRLNFRSLQSKVLLLLARMTAGVGGDLIWISAGELMRTAVFMGLHRDPASLPTMTTQMAELRRRLWFTILELSLESSIYSGGPPMVSLEDFDCSPPRNYDDEQLLADDAGPKPDDQFTDSSITIALSKTLPHRLSLIKFLNDFRSRGTYEGVLQLDAEHKAAHKAASQFLQAFAARSGPAPSEFQIRFTDFIMRRYLLTLHLAFFTPAFQEVAYAYSRKVVIDTSLKIWYGTFQPISPRATATASQSTIETGETAVNAFLRLTVCGSGFFRNVLLQAGLVIAMEIKMQLQEEDSLGVMPVRPDLLSVLKQTDNWSLERIRAGETNIKGYMGVCIIHAHIEALKNNLSKEEMSLQLFNVTTEAVEVCLSILKELLAQVQPDESVDGLDYLTLETPSELTEDWGFLVSCRFRDSLALSHFNIVL
jgi:hypothetical protein